MRTGTEALQQHEVRKKFPIKMNGVGAGRPRGSHRLPRVPLCGVTAWSRGWGQVPLPWPQAALGPAECGGSPSCSRGEKRDRGPVPGRAGAQGWPHTCLSGRILLPPVDGVEPGLGLGRRCASWLGSLGWCPGLLGEIRVAPCPTRSSRPDPLPCGLTPAAPWASPRWGPLTPKGLPAWPWKVVAAELLL